MYQSNPKLTVGMEDPRYPTLPQLILMISDPDFSFPIVADGSAVSNIRFNPDLEPIRRVVRRSNYRQTYQLFSKKMHMTMSCESLIEFNGSYILEAMPHIKRFYLQPSEITYELNGNIRKHIPDALVYFDDYKKCFIEFKSTKESEDPELQERTGLLKRHLPKHGYGYIVVCDEQMADICLKNAKALVHIQHISITEEILIKVKNFLKFNENPNLGHLLHVLDEYPASKNVAFQMIKAGLIGFDFDSKITSESKIFWKEE